MANLKNFTTRDAANRGVWVSIPDPLDGTDSGFRIQILGKDSDAYRKVEATQRERAVRTANTTGNFRITPEAIEQNALELLAVSTIGWDGLEDNGVDVPFTQDKAKELYREYPFVREFVDRSVADRSLFTAR